MTDKPMKFPADDKTLAHEQSPKIALILDQYFEDLQNGRACSREELLERHPDVKDSLVEYLDGLELVAGLGVGSDMVPKHLGDFEVVGPIGQGAMGTVYRAKQLSLKREVALKVLRYSISGDQATKRFEREAELVATLQHPNIVPIYATGQQDGSHFLAMRLIDGPSLAQWSAVQNADRDPMEIAKWGAQVARGLAHAHQRDVIHRDVKPSNLLKEGDHIWLTDFGLARRFDDIRMSMTGAMLGTPNYMSPEQAAPSRHPIDFRTDIYSLGATLFELLTGRCVFVAETPHSVLAQVLAEEAPLLGEVLPDASRDLETILMKCLEKDPVSRYQTVELLAEDLESFAEGRSIQARRPNVIERVSRWQRQNQKAVSWSVAAATAALTLLAVSVGIWFSWKNAKMGTIKVISDEGPIVGRLIDANGKATSTFTIPNQNAMLVEAGEYTLQMWAGGRFGENQRVYVDKKGHSTVQTNLSDEGVFVERTVKGFPVVMPLDDCDDLIFFHDAGITRTDGRNGEDLWTAKAADFVAAANETLDRELSKEVSWGSNFGQIWNYQDRRIPKIAGNFPDVNGDGQADALIACTLQPVLFAFDGANGKLIWDYVATPTVLKGEQFAHSQAATFHAPRSIGDVDGDGIADFASSFCSRGRELYRWIDAISGKSGKRIWRLDISNEWFDASNHLGPEFGTVSLDGYPKHRFMHVVGDHWRFRAGNSMRGQTHGVIAPWRMIPVSDSANSEGTQVFVACGDRLISFNPKTGKPGIFNQGEAYELGFFPALQPQLVKDPDGDNIGLLLCEVLAFADPSASIAPSTRYSMRSIETGEELWHFDAVNDPGWLGTVPDWPLMADVVGDACPEILMPDGNDLGTVFHQNPSCQDSLQALDARTGQPIWDPKRTAKIRCQDRQIQNVIAGLDDDGDDQNDIYAVTTTIDSQCKMFIDVLSGSSGERIRTISADLPMISERSSLGLDLETPFFLGETHDGHPRLVVSTKSDLSVSDRQMTVVISLGTGEVTHVGDQLENPILADGDGDGHKDLFLIKPRNRDNLNESAQLISMKSIAGGGLKLNTGEFTLTDDINGDGIRDLNKKPQGDGVWQTISGSTGESILRWEFDLPSEHVRIGDLDGDGLDDYLAEQLDFASRTPSTMLTAISAAAGNVIWKKEIPSDHFGIRPSGMCHELNLAGRMNLLLIHRSGGQNACWVQLSCLDALTGDENWHIVLAPTGSLPATNSFELVDYDLRIVDVDRDGNLDIVCPIFNMAGGVTTSCFDGRSGKQVWQLPYKPIGNSLKTNWRSEVIPSNNGTDTIFVNAAETTDQKGVSSVTVNFHNLENGELVSSWTANAGLSDRSYRFTDSQKRLVGGIPFPVSDGEKTHTGICLNNEKNELAVVVIDSSTSEAKEIQRIASRDFAPGGRYWNAGDHFLVDDTNNDGSSDGIFYVGGDIVAVDLITNKELMRTTIPSVVDIKRDTNPEHELIQVISKDDEDSRLKLIDLKSLDVVWDMHMPRKRDFKGMLCYGVGSDSGPASRPRAFFAGSSEGQAAYCTTASAAEFRGDSESVSSLRHTPNGSEPNSKSIATWIDPRLIEPLPWNGHESIGSLQNRLVAVLAEEIPVALGAIVFPFLFIRTMFRRKQWNLKRFLLLPLLFVVPYLALQLPLSLGGSVAKMSGVSDFVGNLLVALFVMPTLVCVAVWIDRCWNWKWKSLLSLVIAAIVLSAVAGAYQWFTSRMEMSPGSHYDWYDWRSLELLITGMWLVGLAISAKWAYDSVGDLVNRLFGLIFRRSSTQVVS